MFTFNFLQAFTIHSWIKQERIVYLDVKEKVVYLDEQERNVYLDVMEKVVFLDEQVRIVYLDVREDYLPG